MQLGKLHYDKYANFITVKDDDIKGSRSKLFYRILKNFFMSKCSNLYVWLVAKLSC